MQTFVLLSISMVVGSGRRAAAFSSISGPARCGLSSAPRRLWLGARRQTHLSYIYGDSFDQLETGQPPVSGTDQSDFEGRMKRIVSQHRRAARRRNRNPYRPSNVKVVASLEEFAGAIEEGRRQKTVVVVRFHATWCKKCHSLRPSFDKTAAKNPHVTFVDVPILETNSNLHQGLGVESVPFAHIYHPVNGLVEEMKLSREGFAQFEGLVKLHSL